MRIIQTGIVEFQQSCSSCKSVLGIGPRDFARRQQPDGEGGTETVWFFTCPVCNATILIQPNAIPAVWRWTCPEYDSE